MKRFAPALAIMFIAAVLLIVVLGLRSADQAVNTPPTPEKLMKQFRQHRADIQTVVDYLAQSSYKSVQIRNASGDAWAKDRLTIKSQDPN